MKTKEEVKKSIEKLGIDIIINTIQDLLENSCPCDCINCAWNDLCIRDWDDYFDYETN